MSTFICLILGVFAIYQAFANNQICLSEVGLSFGYFLPFSCFRTLYEISLINCAKECLYRQTRCKSINYIRSELSCSLCEEDAGPFMRNLIEKPGRTHSDIAKWPKDLAGRCKDILCPPTHSCNPLALETNLYEGSDTVCVLSGCGLSPSTNWSTKSTDEEIIGTRVKYSCPNGMTPRGNPIIQCQENGTWTDFNFTCGCGLSPSTNWSTKSTDEEIIGTRVKYSCPNGMTPRGNPIIQCQENGTWTDFNFTCGCGLSPSTNWSTKSTDEEIIGIRVKYSCPNGMTPRGNPIIQCQENGTWTDFNFTCGCGLSPSTNWSTKSTDEEIIGTRVKYSCPNGMTPRGNPIIQCQENGTWTDFNFTCGCGLSPSTNWSTKSTDEEIIGTRVKYSCPNGMTSRGNPIIQCQENGTWTDFNFTCAPRNCKELRDTVQAITGIYLIYPSSYSAGIPVRCDMTTDGGGWTVFQRRVDGSIDFYRGWGDYKSGFGDLRTEFWLGLDIIHTLTSQDTVELRIDLVPTGSPAIPAYAKYATFHVGDENSKYVLNIGNYEGNAGDSLIYHNDSSFTTMDRKNDRWVVGNCAIFYHGAWWYRDCHFSNLNGDYGNTAFGIGLSWNTLSGYYVSMMFTEMKIRGL